MAFQLTCVLDEMYMLTGIWLASTTISFLLLSSNIRPHLNVCVPMASLSQLSDNVHTTFMLVAADIFRVTWQLFFKLSSFTWQYLYVPYSSSQDLTSYFLLSLYKIPLHGYIIFCLSAHLLRNMLLKCTFYEKQLN